MRSCSLISALALFCTPMPAAEQRATARTVRALDTLRTLDEARVTPDSPDSITIETSASGKRYRARYLTATGPELTAWYPSEKRARGVARAALTA